MVISLHCQRFYQDDKSTRDLLFGKSEANVFASTQFKMMSSLLTVTVLRKSANTVFPLRKSGFRAISDSVNFPLH